MSHVNYRRAPTTVTKPRGTRRAWEHRGKAKPKSKGRGISLDYVCIACKCTDSKACRGGCSWALQCPALKVGLCSRCDSPANVERFTQQVYGAYFNQLVMTPRGVVHKEDRHVRRAR